MIFVPLGIRVEIVLLVMVGINWLMGSVLLTIKHQDHQMDRHRLLLMLKGRQLLQEQLQEQLQDQIVNLQHPAQQGQQADQLPNQPKHQLPPKHPWSTTNSHQPQETHY